MNVSYPIFVFAKDDKHISLIEDESGIFFHLEAIDIESEEYALWDANGDGVRIQVWVEKFRRGLKSVSSCPLVLLIREAFRTYVHVLGLPDTIADGAPKEVWAAIQAELDKRPKKQNIFCVFSLDRVTVLWN